MRDDIRAVGFSTYRRQDLGSMRACSHIEGGICGCHAATGLFVHVYLDT